MDLYCPKCSEPWDNDTFHEAADEQNTSYDAITAAFRRVGCTALGWGECNPNGASDPRVSALYDLLGDDMDGAASMFADEGIGYSGYGIE